jgi:hypothetical protein
MISGGRGRQGPCAAPGHEISPAPRDEPCLRRRYPERGISAVRTHRLLSSQPRFGVSRLPWLASLGDLRRPGHRMLLASPPEGRRTSRLRTAKLPLFAPGATDVRPRLPGSKPSTAFIARNNQGGLRGLIDDLVNGTSLPKRSKPH